MLIFNNQQRSGYEEILSYSPEYYKQIREMDAIFRFAGYTLDMMAASLERLMQNQFIVYMDEELVSRLERFYGVAPVGSLDDRRRHILSLYNAVGKTSVSKMIADIEALMGFGTKVDIAVGDKVEISINSLDDTDKTFFLISGYLEQVLPAHLAYELVYESSMAGKNYRGVVWQDDEVFILRQVVV